MASFAVDTQMSSATGVLSSVQQRIQLPGRVHRRKVVKTPNMPIVNIDLRDGPPARALHHLYSLCRLRIDSDLFDVRYTFIFQQALGRDAIRTYRRAIHGDARHHFSTGKLACCQPPMPPANTTTSAKPAFFNWDVAAWDRFPVWQTMTAGRLLNFSSSPIRLSSWAKGIFLEFGACPAPYSAGSRTSIITAFLRLSNCTACMAPTSGTPLKRRFTKGQSRMPPLMTAASTNQILFNTKFTFSPRRHAPLRNSEDMPPWAHSMPSLPIPR